MILLRLVLAAFCRICMPTCMKISMRTTCPICEKWWHITFRQETAPLDSPVCTGPSLRQQPHTTTEQPTSSLPPLDQPEWACPCVEANRGMSDLNRLHVNTTSLIPTGMSVRLQGLDLPVTFCLPSTSFSSPLPPPLFYPPSCPLPRFPSRGAEQTDSGPNWDMCSWVTLP